MATESYDGIVSQFGELSAHEQEKLVQVLAAAVDRGKNTTRRRSILELRGLGKEVWEGVDAAEYVRQQRASWPG